VLFVGPRIVTVRRRELNDYFFVDVVVWGAIQGNQLPGNSPPVTSPFYSARQHGLTFQFNHRDVIVIATESDNTQVPCI
jgi:hypothetical protein